MRLWRKAHAKNRNSYGARDFPPYFFPASDVLRRRYRHVTDVSASTWLGSSFRADIYAAAAELTSEPAPREYFVGVADLDFGVLLWLGSWAEP